MATATDARLRPPLYETHVGKKYAMALSGIVLMLARVPANLDPGRRRRVDGYALTSRRCHEQLAATRRRAPARRGRRALGSPRSGALRRGSGLSHGHAPPQSWTEEAS